MNNENDSKWSAKMLITWAILIDIGLLGCLFIMPLLKLIQDLFQLIYLLIISWFHSMSTLFRRWKNRLRCSEKRPVQHSRSSIFTDTDLKTVAITMDRLTNENRLLKERFDKLDEKCQRWIGDEQIYLLKRIEQLETENRQLHLNYRTYQLKSEKCLQSVTDLIIKLLFTQEELKKQCTDMHNAFDTVQLRKKVQRNDSIPRNARSISCQFTSNSSNRQNRHTTNDQSTWFHRDLMIVEKDDLKMKIDQPTELHISESQSSVYSPTLAANKYKSRLSSTGLTNELYFASHKPDGDYEKTPPVLLRNKRRSPHVNSTPLEDTPVLSHNRRPISSPVRSTTYVLQQHHRINNTNQTHQTNGTSKKHLSPVTQHRQTTPVILNKTRQIQQQRTYSNHERSSSTVNTSPINQQFTSRAHITLASQRTTPTVKNTPTKTSTNISRSPRILHTTPVRPSRPTAPTPAIPNQQRSPQVQLRSQNITARNQRTISSSPTTPSKIVRPQRTVTKSPEPLRSVTGTITRPRPAHTTVNKSKMCTTNNQPKNRIPAVVVQAPCSSVTTTPRVSDIDALMAEKQNNKVSPNRIEEKSSAISPSPIANNIRRSLFSGNTVKIVRPVRSQELKTFSCHLTTPTTAKTTVSRENHELHIDETTVTTSSIISQTKIDHPLHIDHTCERNDDSSSTTSAILRDLSADSLNEHYHIRQLLKSNASITGMRHDSTTNDSSADDIQCHSGVTSWSRIRSSCESNLSHAPPLPSDISASPAFYNGPVRQEDIHMASDGRYFLLIDDNISSDESQLSTKSLSSSSISLPELLSPPSTPPPPPQFETPSIIIPTTIECKPVAHRLVFPERLGRVLFYRRTLSDSDIYQKLCSKDNEINHNVYHLDTIRDYAMEFYMLTTYGSDSQLRAWLGSHYDDTANNTCYFDDNRFQSYDDDDEDEDDNDILEKHEMKIIESNDSIVPKEDPNHLQIEEELDWYSELESFNLLPNNHEWKHENLSSCSSDDHVQELLRAEQFSISSLTTTTSAESSCSAGLISASWPTANGIHHPVHSSRSSQSLSSPPSSSKHTDQSNIILKEILTYPWTNEISDATINSRENGHDRIENGLSTSSIVSDEFQPDFYYLCPLKNTTSFLKTDEKSNGIHKQLSHDA